MQPKDIPGLRLDNQQIVSSEFIEPESIVSWMGAIQAQDFAMVRWGVGLRIPGSNEDSIIKAIDDGKIIRTHVLRPTWHLVSAEDISWMLQLTSPHIMNSMKSRHRELGIDKNILKKSNSVIEKLLTREEQASREEIVEQLKKNKIQTDMNRASHLLFSAELAGIICSGKFMNNKHSYALLDKRVKKKKIIRREEALFMLAEKYFKSHGPASLEDFTWWSGLPVKDARTAVESVRTSLISENLDSVEYLMPSSDPLNYSEEVHLLPAYDEFIISYKNRTHLLNGVNNSKVISINGLFRPVVLFKGKVTGIWKRTVKKDIVNVEVSLFQLPDRVLKKLIKSAADKYGSFLRKDVNYSVYR